MRCATISKPDAGPFGGNPADYLPAVLTPWEGTRCYNYSPPIYAHGQENIAIIGRGTLDGWKRTTRASPAALIRRSTATSISKA